MDEIYFLRRRFADGREETEFMSLEDAFHRQANVLVEEVLDRHKGAAPNVVYVCWGMQADGKESIGQESNITWGRDYQ